VGLVKGAIAVVQDDSDVDDRAAWFDDDGEGSGTPYHQLAIIGGRHGLPEQHRVADLGELHPL